MYCSFTLLQIIVFGCTLYFQYLMSVLEYFWFQFRSQIFFSLPLLTQHYTSLGYVLRICTKQLIYFCYVVKFIGALNMFSIQNTTPTFTSLGIEFKKLSLMTYVTNKLTIAPHCEENQQFSDYSQEKSRDRETKPILQK